MTPQSPLHKPSHSQPLPARRPPPLTDDQYLATSLALVATLSRRVREGAPRHG